MRKLVFLSVLALLASCCTKATDDKVNKGIANNDYMELAVLSQQSSAEYVALCHQAFNLARVYFDQAKPELGKKPCIIVDIDETILDNSPYEAACVLQNISYPDQWDQWVLSSRAEAVPGSLDFLKYVASQKTDIFYVTNRKEKFRKATLKNLKEKEFPQADDDHVFMQTDSSTKEMYREKIRTEYHIILLAGDNLADFSPLFYKQDDVRRKFLADSLKTEFGSRFIVLPNPMYGDWEQCLYKNLKDLNPAQKDSIRKSKLTSF